MFEPNLKKIFKYISASSGTFCNSAFASIQFDKSPRNDRISQLHRAKCHSFATFNQFHLINVKD